MRSHYPFPHLEEPEPVVDARRPGRGGVAGQQRQRRQRQEEEAHREAHLNRERRGEYRISKTIIWVSQSPGTKNIRSNDIPPLLLPSYHIPSGVLPCPINL